MGTPTCRLKWNWRPLYIGRPAAPCPQRPLRAFLHVAAYLFVGQLRGHRAGHRIRRDGLRPARGGAVPSHCPWEASGGGEAEVWSQGRLPCPWEGLGGHIRGGSLAGCTDSPSRWWREGSLLPRGRGSGPCLGHTPGPSSLASVNQRESLPRAAGWGVGPQGPEGGGGGGERRLPELSARDTQAREGRQSGAGGPAGHPPTRQLVAPCSRQALPTAPHG